MTFAIGTCLLTIMEVLRVSFASEWKWERSEGECAREDRKKAEMGTIRE
ncbi:hypothetical protein [Neobacillus sp. LXY-4]